MSQEIVQEEYKHDKCGVWLFMNLYLVSEASMRIHAYWCVAVDPLTHFTWHLILNICSYSVIIFPCPDHIQFYT